MREEQWRRRCYKTHGGTLIALGLLLIFLCIPGWAWAALGGAALIAVGWLLIRAEKGGR